MYSAKVYPDCTWRPYGPTSAFNTPVKNPSIASNSKAILDRLKFSGGANRYTGPIGSGDWMHPVYWGAPTDSAYTVKLVSDNSSWMNSEQRTLFGAKVHAPKGMKPAGGGDGHLGVVDQTNGIEYSFWIARVDDAAKVITADGGGYVGIGGSGITQYPATAAHFGCSAGQIRACELAGANVDHALFLVVNKVASGPWLPAMGEASAGGDPTTTPHNGQRLWLDMLWPEIDGLPEKPWGKAVLRALSRYGALVGDTGGESGVCGVNSESQQPYVTFLGKNPMADFAKQQGGLDLGAVLDKYKSRMKWLAKP